MISYFDENNGPLRLAAALGVKALRWTNTQWGNAGNNTAAVVQHANAAVSMGYADYVVVYRAIAQGQFFRAGTYYADTQAAQGEHAWRHVYGQISPAQDCALKTKRFMHDHGISQEALCDIALACYANAQRNPRAIRYGSPLTREDYHASRMIAEPFHIFDCCPETDGAAAIIVPTPERARDLKGPAVPILAAAQGLGPEIGMRSYQGGWLGRAYYQQVGETLWQLAGLRPTDVDVVQFYENFTGPAMMALCELGFYKPDEVEAFVAGGALEGSDAKLPFNTSGGNIGEAYIHGFGLVNEAVRQIRGDSTCQVEGADLSLCVGGPWYAPGSAILFGRS